MAIDLRINGQQRSFEQPLSGAELLDALAITPSTVVVELNGDIIKRELFLERQLQDGDQLELVTIVGGG